MAAHLHAHGPKRYITEKDIVRRGALSCIASPSETEGPYYVSGMPYRKNITEGRPGLPLTLTITVLDLASCLPTSKNLTLELWHCDHLGIYSHYEEASKSFSNPKTDNNKYFRGKTLIDQSTGIAVFETIYPGWYTGRDIHFHVRVWSGSSILLTTQFSFNDTITATVQKISPYTSNTNQRTYLLTDTVFSDNGVLGMLDIQQKSSSDITKGFNAYVSMGVSLNGTTVTTNNGTTVANFAVSVNSGLVSLLLILVLMF